MLDPQPGSADWWLMRLSRKLAARRRELDVWWDWYTGEHPLPSGPAKAVQAYRDFQKSSRTNFLAKVVDASVFKLQVIGVTDADGRPDDEAWSWWQKNRLDSRQKQVFRTSLSQSESYLLVGEHPTIAGQPLITPEHPRECIVEEDPGTGERLAGLKVWYDEVAGEARATVFLPNVRVEYRRGQAARRFTPSVKGWEPGEVVQHDFVRVPLVPFQCRPDLGEDPQPEFVRGIPCQQRINLGVLNRMTAARYSAFRQRYVTGHKFQTRTVMTTEVDPETGLEIEVPKKVPTGNPFIPDPAAVWVSEGENARFGEFSQTDLQGYVQCHNVDIRDLLTLTHTPTYGISTDLVNIATDTIIALDSEHHAKVREHMAHFGEQFEDVLGLAAVVAGVDRDFTAHEVRWQDPRTLNPAVVADMGIKLRSMGYPLGVVAERMGDSPQQIKRIVAGQAGEVMVGAASQQPVPTGPGAAAAVRDRRTTPAPPPGDETT